MNKGLLVFGAVVVLDQFSKFLAEKSQLVTLNPGISFGLFSGIPPIAMNIVVLVFLGGMYWWWRCYWQERPIVAGLFFGGAVSNILDRIIAGGVQDWLPIPGTSVHNNLADWAIFVGLVWAGIVEFKVAQHKKQKI